MTPEMEHRIIEEARSWCGTRFHHGSRIRGVGVDCINLVAAVLEAAGVIAPQKMPSYPPDWPVHSRRERLLEGLATVADPVEPPWEIGDILTFRYARAASHCGLYVGNGQIVHAATKDKVRCDQMDSRPLAKRFVAAFRVRR